MSVSYQRYVAIGDSTTEGLIDPDPWGGPRDRGWADRLAEKLALVNPAIRYANLAIRGRKLPQIRAEQLQPALALEPDLASVLGGVNDILRREVDLEARAEDLETIVAELRASGAEVIMSNYPSIAGSISFGASRFAPRIRDFNRTIAEIAARHDAYLVDLEADDIDHPVMWAPDRLHASSIGHERIADLAAARLGLEQLDPGWEAALPAHAPPSRPRRIARDALWAGRHMMPWILRRIRGVSSGDGIEPKRPRLGSVRPTASGAGGGSAAEPASY
jgi:lysophospholipase L1-like esterase